MANRQAEMSNDRVSFMIREQHLSGSYGIRQLIADVFSLYESDYNKTRDLHILCRPDQFARFLIHRNDRGFNNGFKDLCPKLITAARKPCVHDVSGNPTRQLS